MAPDRLRAEPGGSQTAASCRAGGQGCPYEQFPRGLVLLGTMREMEPKAMADLKKLFGLPVWLLRLLHPGTMAIDICALSVQSPH